MKTFDVISILGALSWLPHLVRIIKDLLATSEIRILTPKTIQIGYNPLGPILNTNLAFDTKKQEIVISSLKINVEHESGEKHILSWYGIVQPIAEVRSEENSFQTQKVQSVLTIKLNPKEVEEKFFQFQEDEYHDRKAIYEEKVAKHLFYLQEKGNYSLDECLKSDEMMELYSYIKQAFIWKQGSYKISFEIQSNDKFKLKDNHYTFVFSSIDIEELEKNKGLIEYFYEEQIKAIIIKDCKPNNVMWNWRFPILKKQAKQKL